MSGRPTITGKRLEHINITIRDMDSSTRFLMAALPEWRVRGEGRMDWFGKSIGWRHVQFEFVESLTDEVGRRNDYVAR